MDGSSSGEDRVATGLRASVSRRAILIGSAAAAGGLIFGSLGQRTFASRMSLIGEEAATMSTIRTDDGVNLSYRLRGDGPLNLLFMHGWAGSGAYFDETINRLDLTGLRAITYDFRGHGDSDKVETGYTLDRFAQDALTVMNAVEADEVVVVGYSMSGRFSQYIAAMEPERVTGQVLIAGWPATEVPLPVETIEDWVGRAGDRERLRELEEMFITRPLAPGVLDRWLDDAVKVSPAVLDATLQMSVQTSFVDRLATLRTPTLVVGGLHDPVATPDFLRQGVVEPLVAANARLALLDCNHDVPIEQPQEMAALIEAFAAAIG